MHRRRGLPVAPSRGSDRRTARSRAAVELPSGVGGRPSPGRAQSAVRRPLGRSRVPVVVAVARRCAGRVRDRQWDGRQLHGQRLPNRGLHQRCRCRQAIDCLDHPTDRDPAGYPALAAKAAQTAPIFGPLLIWGLLGCAVSSEPPTRTPGPATDPGAPPILIIGTVNDPVTPYAWSVGLARELTGGVLLTWQGHSHVAYFYSPCVRGVVQSYLVDGSLPAPGATCSD